jgi:hypothetical protein
MADEPFHAGTLWTLHKLDGRIACELRLYGEWGWEVELFRNGAFYAGRRFKLREGALRHADVLKADLIGLGWRVEP